MYQSLSKLSPTEIYKIIERLVKLKFALMGNVNPKLVAQVLPGYLSY